VPRAPGPRVAPTGLRVPPAAVGAFARPAPRPLGENWKLRASAWRRRGWKRSSTPRI